MRTSVANRVQLGQSYGRRVCFLRAIWYIISSILIEYRGCRIAMQGKLSPPPS